MTIEPNRTNQTPMLAVELAQGLAGFAVLGTPEGDEAHELAARILANAPEAARAHRCGVCLGDLEGERDPGLPLCDACGRRLHELVKMIIGSLVGLLPMAGRA